jgi:hypothetical protein
VSNFGLNRFTKKWDVTHGSFDEWGQEEAWIPINNGFNHHHHEASTSKSIFNRHAFFDAHVSRFIAPILAIYSAGDGAVVSNVQKNSSATTGTLLDTLRYSAAQQHKQVRTTYMHQ